MGATSSLGGTDSQGVPGVAPHGPLYMRHEAAGNTLPATALVDEVSCAWLRWMASVGRTELIFSRVSANMMRRILVDRARAKGIIGLMPVWFAQSSGGQRLPAKSPDRVRQPHPPTRGRTRLFVAGASIWLSAEARRLRTEPLWPSPASSPSCSITSGPRKSLHAVLPQKLLEDFRVHLLR